MMWAFAVLVVLALGGVAVVAAGRGAPLEPAYDDSPDTLVPAGRPITGDDLRRVRFPLAFRGYRMAEVDALLDRLATELDQARDLDRAREPAAGVGPHEDTDVDAGVDAGLDARVEPGVDRDGDPLDR
jgi:DivIVA domain-containing protein